MGDKYSSKFTSVAGVPVAVAIQFPIVFALVGYAKFVDIYPKFSDKNSFRYLKNEI